MFLQAGKGAENTKRKKIQAVLYMLWKGLVCILQNPTKAMDL
jgi:hypothetical protein